MKTTTLKPGQIVLVAFPFTDQTSAKVRPALVVYGGDRGDFIALATSRQLDPADPHKYEILDSDPCFKQTQLRWSSAIRCNMVMTLNTTLVTRALGTVPQDVLSEILAKFKGLF